MADKRIKKNSGLVLVFVAVFILGLVTGYVAATVKKCNDASETDGNKQNREVSAEIKNPDNEKISQRTEEKEARRGENAGSLAPLKKNLEKEIEKYDGKWSLYVENLENGEKFEINNQKMRSASVIKLFIMGKVFEEIEGGNIEKDDVNTYLENMITISDNESSNILVSLLGGGKYSGMDEVFLQGTEEVNDFAEGIGCEVTEQQRDMKNSRPEPIPQENYTSARDCGIFLSKLYHKELVSKKADDEMLELLKNQQRRGKIPKGLPENCVCANKTGELSAVENDVAIVFSPGGDYVICVMSDDVTDTFKARENIAWISERVYNYFNEE